MPLFTSNWMMLFPIAFSLFVAMRLSMASIDDGRPSVLLLAVRGVVLSMFIFALLALGVRGNFLSTMWLVMITVFGLIFLFKRRRLERTGFYLTCVTADTLSQQQTLAGFFADESVGWMRRRGNLLRRDLATGVPWAQALEFRGIASGVYEKIALRLRSTYGDTESSEVDPRGSVAPLEIEAETERLLGRLMLFSWSILIFPLVALIMTFIVPTFKEMFDEFGLELPPATKLMIASADFSMEYGIAHVLSLVPLLLLAAIGVMVFVWIFPATLQLPAFRWVCGDYYLNAGLTALSRVSEREPNLIVACQKTAELVPVPHVRQKFIMAGERLMQGEEILEAFQLAGLANAADVRGLNVHFDSTVATQSDVTWGLRQLANWRVERMLSRYSLLVQTLVVLITAGFAFVVGLVAIGLLSALTQMILNLA